MDTGRIHSGYVEVIEFSTPQPRLHSGYVETIELSTPQPRLYSGYVEAIITNAPFPRLHSGYIEILFTNDIEEEEESGEEEEVEEIGQSTNNSRETILPSITFVVNLSSQISTTKPDSDENLNYADTLESIGIRGLNRRVKHNEVITLYGRDAMYAKNVYVPLGLLRVV